MESNAYIGSGPQIIVAIKDGPMVRVYTGRVIDGDISINTQMDEIYDRVTVHEVPIGRTVKLNVEFRLDYHGGQMKTWADIKEPEEINAAQPDIEPDQTV